ncbi:MAG: pilus assembly protein [Acidobacteria bacterium]|nr:pilus assembly protein [Acidobacteriota bacterium]
MTQTKNKKRRGQALVESALVMLVFLATIIGIMDFAQILFVHQSLVERVRSSIRWGAVRSFDAPSIQNMVLYNNNTAPQGVSPAAFLGLTAANVQVARADADTEMDRLTVSIVNYDYHFFSPWISHAFQNNLAVVESLPFEYKP